jgi:hypothetical protein
MEYTTASEFKPLDINPYERYYRKIVRIQPIGSDKSINGEVVSLTDRHITLEHLDKRRSLVRLSEIAVISEVPRKPPRDVV